MGFVALDLETTGLFPSGYDRIIEIALVEVSDTGEPLREWTTLVNPQRDIGPTAIHGLRAADCAGAPTFDLIAADIHEWLSGSVIIGHNVSFDRRFLEAEFARLGACLPIVGSVCTLQLARRTRITPSGRSLESLCNALHVPLPMAHSALNDTRATLGLLRQLTALCGADSLKSLTSPLTPAAELHQPQFRRPCAAPVSRLAAQERRKHAPSPIRRVIDALPRNGSTFPETDSYLEVLDRALLDRRLTSSECEDLLSVAKALGLNEATVIAAHHRYLADLIRQAWMDGVLTDLEAEDLTAVRILLGVPEADFERMLAFGRESAESTPKQPERPVSQFKNRSICFTGALVGTIKGAPIKRVFAESLAEERGMIVKSSVSNRLDYLVAADPDSQSGKATQARELGVTILAESVFWSMMGVRVD